MVWFPFSGTKPVPFLVRRNSDMAPLKYFPLRPARGGTTWMERTKSGGQKFAVLWVFTPLSPVPRSPPLVACRGLWPGRVEGRARRTETGIVVGIGLGVYLSTCLELSRALTGLRRSGHVRCLGFSSPNTFSIHQTLRGMQLSLRPLCLEGLTLFGFVATNYLGKPILPTIWLCHVFSIIALSPCIISEDPGSPINRTLPNPG